MSLTPDMPAIRFAGAAQQRGATYITAKMLFARYNVSEMAVVRWLNGAEPDFPKPIKIAGRRYWRLDELEAFERRREACRD